MSVVVNTTERRVTIKITRGPKGAPFTYDDFTPEQLEGLKLTFADLTEADKEELKLKFSDLTPEEKEELSLKWDQLTPEQKAELKGDKGEPFTYEDFTAAQLAALKGDKGDPFTYEDFTQAQKDEVFNTFLSNFYDPSIVALSSRGSNEGATFQVKLNKIQDEMNILDPIPDLLMLPSGIKAGKLYSILPEDGSGDFTVARNSTATRVNAEGNRETVAANVPRIDFSTGEGILLVEKESTNLITSTFFVPTNFEGTNQDIGGYEYRVNHIAGSLRRVTNVQANQAYTFSIGIKGTIGNQLRFYIVNPDSPYNGDNLYHTIAQAGYHRIAVPHTTITGQTRLDLRIYNTTGTAIEYHYKNMQLEQGLTATSTIPTAGSIATRLADNIFTTFPKTGDATITFADGTTQTISGNQGDTLTLPQGLITKVEML